MKRFCSDSWTIAWRELKHFFGQRVRIFMVVIQPLIWLTLMGNMFQQIARVPGFPAETYLDYMAPGIVVMVTLFGGIFGGMSLVWDRRLGFLQKMLAAPISRSAVVTGKMTAIAIQTVFQTSVIFGLALLMGVKFQTGAPGFVLLLLLAVLLGAVFAGLSLGLAAVLTSHETLMVVINFMTMPLMFTSSAMMPVTFMPSWLAALARWNPLTYAVHPMRALFLSGFDWPALFKGIGVLAPLTLLMAALSTSLLRRSPG